MELWSGGMMEGWSDGR